MQRKGELPLLDVARVCSMLLPEGLVEVDSTYFQVRSHHSMSCKAQMQPGSCKQSQQG